MDNALLSVDDVTVWLPTADGPKDIVKHVSLQVARGEIVGLAGESGSGKTMLSKAIAGILPRNGYVEGSIQLDGQDVSALSTRDRRHLLGTTVGVLPQDPLGSLHPMLTVGHQLTDHMRSNLGVRRRAALARAVDLLRELRVPDPEGVVKQYPHQLSGGMRQRVVCAIALACEPELIIGDEPTTALDVTVQAATLRLLKGLVATRDIGLLFITHDLAVLAAITDRMLIMQQGEIIETGPTSEIVAHPSHPYTSGLIDALRPAEG
jgi:ABC-type dipeptide/oligopeptide/nickel transport system ATPase component